MSFFKFTGEVSEKLREAKLTGTEWRIWSILVFVDPSNCDPKAIWTQAGCSKSAFYRAIAKFEAFEIFDLERYGLSKNYNNTESQVRDRLHEKLGGLTEVVTPNGRIDLLTDTEIIEVKRIEDWKAALGQILVYSAFYPEHKKRLHLFGNDEVQITDIASACLPFGVLVTFEVLAEVEA